LFFKQVALNDKVMKRIAAGLILAIAVSSSSNAAAGPIGHILKAPFKTVGYAAKGTGKIVKGAGEIVIAPVKAVF
jgi:hypothetical protein